MDNAIVKILVLAVEEHPCIHSWIPVRDWLNDHDQNYVCRYCEMQIGKQVFNRLGRKENLNDSDCS